MKKLMCNILLFIVAISIKAQSDNMASFDMERNMPSFYREAKKRLTYPMAWGNSSITHFDEWRKESRKILLESMQNQPPAPTSYHVEIVYQEHRKGYTAQKIRFNISAWSRIPAYLLVPDGKGAFPAILMLHDHGAHFSIGKEKMVKPFRVPDSVLKDADTWAHGCYDDQYVGDYFAANGYVVLAIDALFWGERGRKEGVDYDGQQALAANLMQLGMSFGGVITTDDMRSAEFLSTHPNVKADKIGSLGFSMGAYRSWMLSAATDKISASASICWMNTTDSLMTLTNNQNRGGAAFSMLLPTIRRYMDYPHVASIACPKPTLMFNGTKDKLFPVKGVEEAYSTMREVWRSQKQEEKLVTKIWDEKHFFSKAMQKETLDFFDQWLK